jgi:hypothetical protein
MPKKIELSSAQTKHMNQKYHVSCLYATSSSSNYAVLIHVWSIFLCASIMWQFWTPSRLPAVRLILGRILKHGNNRVVVRNNLWELGNLMFGEDCPMEQFNSQFKLGFEIVTGTLIVASKWSPSCINCWLQMITFRTEDVFVSNQYRFIIDTQLPSKVAMEILLSSCP